MSSKKSKKSKAVVVGPKTKTKTKTKKSSREVQSQLQAPERAGGVDGGGGKSEGHGEVCEEQCGKALTSRDFWKHCSNRVLAGLYRGLWDASTIENFGLYNSQTTGTAAYAAMIHKILRYTLGAFKLNGTVGLAESNAPDEVKNGFFCDENGYRRVLEDILPSQQAALWAANDREGSPYLRFDSGSLLHGSSVLSTQDIAFFYLGCSFQGLNPCAWAAAPDFRWPFDPNTTVADLLANALMEITIQNYNVDGRNLVGIPGLGRFTSVTLTLREALVSPLPIAQIGGPDPWLCAIWFMFQQYLCAVLNSLVCTMNYRFPTSFLLGGGAWHILRQFSELYLALNLSTGGLTPIDEPSLTAALTRIMTYICSLKQENDRGNFTFDCDPITGSGGSTGGPQEPEQCAEPCDPLGSEAGESGNQDCNSNLGNGLCECPPCFSPDRSHHSSSETCDPCPTRGPPYCFPLLLNLAVIFVNFAYVLPLSSQSQLQRIKLEAAKQKQKQQQKQQQQQQKQSDGKSFDAPSSETAETEGEKKVEKEKGGVQSQQQQQQLQVSTTSTSSASAMNYASSQQEARRRNREISANTTDAVKQLFQKIERDGRPAHGLLALLYLAYLHSVQPTSLAHNLFTLNPSSFIQSLAVEFENILRQTLGNAKGSIRLNHSPGKIKRTHLTKLFEITAYPLQNASFISCTNDIFSGERYDFLAMVEAVSSVAENDFWAFYQEKKLEGVPPCVWGSVSACWWSVNPRTRLSDVLSHPLAGILLEPYLYEQRSFTGIVGLSAFSGVTLTLREVLLSPNPIGGGPYLDFLWFLIKEAIAGYLNANAKCLIFYRFPSSAYVGGLVFVLLRIFSDIVLAISSGITPTPPIDSMLVATGFSRLLVTVVSLAHENRRGYCSPPSGFSVRKCRRESCGCLTKEGFSLPNIVSISRNFISWMTNSSIVA